VKLDTETSNQQPRALPHQGGPQSVWLRAICIGVGLVFASTGCRQIVAFDQETPEAGTYASSNGLAPFVDAACGSCVDRRCAGEAKRCAADPSCRAYEECVTACAPGSTATACVASCLPRVPSAVLSAETRALAHCVADACKVECPSSVVTRADGKTCGPSIGATQCVSCCCDEFRACDDDPTCVRQIACSRACRPVDGSPFAQSCFETCTGKQPDPFSPLADIGACATQRCKSQCSAMEDWSCLGNVQSPNPAASRPLKVFGTVLKFPEKTTLEGFEVKGCYPSDFPCQEPFDSGMTDGDGHFVLDLRKNIFESPMFFEVTAPADFDYPKHLFFLPSWILTNSLQWTFALNARHSPFALPVSEPGLGAVLFFAYDCGQALNSAAGVEVQATAAGASAPLGAPSYVKPGYPVDPNATFTDGDGVGFIINLPAGLVTLSAFRHETGEQIGQTRIVIQPEAMTIAHLVPTSLSDPP